MKRVVIILLAFLKGFSIYSAWLLGDVKECRCSSQHVSTRKSVGKPDFMESAIGHLKEEEVWQKESQSFEDAYTNLSYFLDVFDNHLVSNRRWAI